MAKLPAGGKPAPRSKKPADAKTKGAAGIGAPEKRVRVDWDAVERDYRTAKFTLRELAQKYGITHQAVAKQSKVKQWSQDLAGQIRQATNAKLVAKLVDDEVAKGGQAVAETVLVAAEVNTRVILGHRKDIHATRDVAAALLNELAESSLLTQHKELLAEILAGDGAEPVDVARAQAAVRKALDVGTRVASVKALAETFTKLQAMERTAFNLDEPDKNPADADGLPKLTDAERAIRLARLMKRAEA